MANGRRTWPYNGQADSPVALSLSPDTLLRSDRSLAARGRLGTAPGVGPVGFTPGGRAASDFGLDNVSPRRFDPLGTPDVRSPSFPGSTRIRR